jgi:hypothetical protein
MMLLSTLTATIYFPLIPVLSLEYGNSNLDRREARYMDTKGVCKTLLIVSFSPSFGGASLCVCGR